MGPAVLIFNGFLSKQMSIHASLPHPGRSRLFEEAACTPNRFSGLLALAQGGCEPLLAGRHFVESNEMVIKIAREC